MPTYVYKFVDTGETIEVQQAFTDDALTEAPHPGDGKFHSIRVRVNLAGHRVRARAGYVAEKVK